MGAIVRRQIDPLSDAAVRQAALRGATLLVLVSIVMAGAPLERGGPPAIEPLASHREARLVSSAEPTHADAASDQPDENGGAAAILADLGLEWQGAAGAVLPSEPESSVRPHVRVALLDLPPPIAA
jgi:hypothetical protein